MSTHHRRVPVSNVDIFYREAGRPGAPRILLLHGFPASSHMYRNLIPALAETYHVIAPDLPGFGFTEAPARGVFSYVYENLTRVIEQFVEKLNMFPFVLVVFDSGAPVGFRVAVAHPEWISAIITQNGNAYEEGLSESWRPVQDYWSDPNETTRSALRGLLKLGTTKWRYTHGTHDVTLVAPEAYLLDQALLDWPDNDEIQLDLLLDYASNIALYPVFQAYFRSWRPPALVIWSNNDPIYLPIGARAFQRDIPDVDIHFVDAGHFALETRGEEIADLIIAFLARVLENDPSGENADD